MNTILEIIGVMALAGAIGSLLFISLLTAWEQTKKADQRVKTQYAKFEYNRARWSGARCSLCPHDYQDHSNILALEPCLECSCSSFEPIRRPDPGLTERRPRKGMVPGLGEPPTVPPRTEPTPAELDKWYQLHQLHQLLKDNPGRPRS